MDLNNPEVGVFRSLKTKGLTHIDLVDEFDKAYTQDDLHTAIMKSWKFDACLFTCRIVPDDKFKDIYRIKKECVPSVREREGHDVVQYILCLDFDNPGHKQWEDFEEDMRPIAVGEVVEKCSDIPGFNDFRYFYFSRSGFRLVYVLKEPMPVEESMARSTSFVREIVNKDLKNIEIDQTTTHWWRLFRLPYATKSWKENDRWENYRLEDCPYVDTPQYQKDTFFDLAQYDKSNYSKLTMQSTSKMEVYEPENLPINEEALALVHGHSGTGSTLFWKFMKKRLKKKPIAHAIINEHEPLNMHGERENTLFLLINEVVDCALSIQRVATTPMHIYGAIVEVLGTIDPIEGEEPLYWYKNAWEKCIRIFQEKYHRRMCVIERQEDIKKHQQLGFEEWIDDAKYLYGNEAVKKEYLDRHRLLYHDGKVFILGPDGYYIPRYINKEMIIPTIKEYQLEDTINIVNDEGKPISDRDLLIRYGTQIDTVIYRTAQCDGVIEGKSLCLPIARINRKLAAEYNEDVDTWLKKFFGDYYEAACQWIGLALCFDIGPICALSIQGPASAGKKLLVQGLAECLENTSYCTGDDLVGNFQEGLIRSPFLYIDEGWPAGAANPMDAFRAMTGGGAKMVNMKFKAPAKAFNAIRMILTANNGALYSKLTHSSHGATKEDTEAVNMRIAHIEITNEASIWLESKGGYKLTNGWISKEDGSGSDYIVAKHFLYLYEKYKVETPGKRFLMSRNDFKAMSPEHSKGLKSIVDTAMNTPWGGMAARCIVDIIESSSSHLYRLHENKIWVTVDSIIKQVQKNQELAARMPDRNVSDDKIRNLLNVLSSDSGKKPFDLEGKIWYGFEVHRLKKISQENGWDFTDPFTLEKEEE